MTIEEYNAKRGMLKSGYTTGTCATAAAKAAVFLLFGNQWKDCEAVKVQLPIGIELQIPIEDVRAESDCVTVTVQKYSGDDPDITNGMRIGARAEFLDSKDAGNASGLFTKCCMENGVEICGGVGIGRVTKAGLRIPVGEAAINPTPRQMILSEVLALKKQYHISSCIRVTIFAPEGEGIAKKTFNPKLGIVGGISILGTSGLVMPMSSRALIETIEVEMKFHKEKSRTVISAPGSYGSSFLKSEFGIGANDLVEFSNYPGEMLDIAVKLDVEELVLCGHIGKMVKLAGGIMNTHSNEADARLELISAHVLKYGVSVSGSDQGLTKSDCFDIASGILECLTTAEAVEVLKRENILGPVMRSLAQNMLKYVKQRLEKAAAFQKKSILPKVEIMVYTLEEGLLARSGEELLRKRASKLIGRAANEAVEGS